MVPPQFQVSAAVHLLQNRPPEDSFFSSRGRSPQPQSSRSARYSVEASSSSHVVRQTSTQMQNGGIDAASVVVSTMNSYKRPDGLSAMAPGAMPQERSPSPAPRVPPRLSSHFAPHSVRSPPPMSRESVRFSSPSFTPTQVTRQTTDGRSMSIAAKPRLASAVPSSSATREASTLRSTPDSFVSTLPSFYSGQGISVQPFKNVPTPLVQRGGSRILSPMMSSRLSYGGPTPAVASTPRVPVQSHVSDRMPVGQFLSPRPGASTPMPSPPPLIYASPNEWSLGPSVRQHNSNPIGETAPRMPRQSRLTNSTPELLPPPWSPQVSDLLMLRPGASPPVQSVGGTHSPRPQGSPVWKTLPPPVPVRMTSGAQVVSDVPLSDGPRVDWNGFEERWYRGDFIEGKLRSWLATIPITGATDRAWDDTQIINLVQFAQDNRVEHLPAEEIYRQYVMQQVEMADMD